MYTTVKTDVRARQLDAHAQGGHPRLRGCSGPDRAIAQPRFHAFCGAPKFPPPFEWNPPLHLKFPSLRESIPGLSPNSLTEAPVWLHFL